MPSELDFHLETGRVSLDLAATLGDRFGDPLERLSDVSALNRWLEIVAGRDVTGPLDRQGLARTCGLRTSIGKVADALVDGNCPPRADIETINRFAAIVPFPPRLAPDGTSRVPSAPPSLDVVLGDIARDAIALFVSADMAKVKRCEASDCSVLFVDYSRPGRRRWCSMARCGNRAKKRTYNDRARRGAD